METREQVDEAFRADLQALLNKYGAAMEAEDHWTGYAECGQDVRMTVYVPAIWDGSTQLRQDTTIDLGSRVLSKRSE